jgi:hypothetical protein
LRLSGSRKRGARDAVDPEAERGDVDEAAAAAESAREADRVLETGSVEDGDLDRGLEVEKETNGDTEEGSEGAAAGKADLTKKSNGII